MRGTQTRRDQTAGGGSRRRESHVKSEMGNRAPLNSTFRVPRRILGKTTPQKHAVNVENNTLNWVSISSDGALDMPHCDFSVRSARDGMRHIFGSSEPDVIIGSDKDQNMGCKKKDKDHMEFLCELYEAQAARGRDFVHELTSEVNSRKRCVAKIMAMPAMRTAVADLCMFGLATCYEGRPGFVNASVRTITNGRQVVVRWRSKCSTARHARGNANNTIEKGKQTGAWVRQVAQAMEEQLSSRRLKQRSEVRGCRQSLLSTKHGRLSQ